MADDDTFFRKIADSDRLLERNPSDVNRIGFPDAAEMWFIVQAGDGASMHGKPLSKHLRSRLVTAVAGGLSR